MHLLGGRSYPRRARHRASRRWPAHTEDELPANDQPSSSALRTRRGSPSASIDDQTPPRRARTSSSLQPHPVHRCARDAWTPIGRRTAASTTATTSRRCDDAGRRLTMLDDVDRRHLDAIADADLFPYWYDDVDEPDSNPTLVRNESCDLCVVGGGYTGLWTAIIAKERDPSRDVVLIDAAEIGSAASGRNGGFMESSLTHGIANGQAALPRRDRAARAARPGEPRRHRERHPPLRHRLRLRAHRRHRRGHDGPRRRATSTSCATTPSSCAGSARTPAGSTPTRCAPRSTRRPTSAGCGGSAGPRSSTRPGWRGG